MARIEMQILCICLPLLWGSLLCLGAPPLEDVLRQQLSPAGLYREDGYWYYPEMRLRAAYDGEHTKNPWRVNYHGKDQTGGKRAGGGLDSLGRGNILRRSSGFEETEDFQRYLRAIDSLGGGNLL
jgi:hypothetical protein